MQITCPHCRFSKDVNQAWIPIKPSQVECPSCQKTFFFSQEGGESLQRPQAEQPRVTCPACGLEQPPGDHCASCGIFYAKWQKKQQEAQGGDFPQDEFFTMEGDGEEIPVEALPKAGFWIRVAAIFLDGLILGVVLGGIFWFAVGGDFLKMFFTMQSLQQGAVSMDDPQVQQVMMQAQTLSAKAVIWNLILTLAQMAYYVLFTAFSGQTLGKKICGIRVVRPGRQSVGIGWAILREVIGKFVSAIILGIGYLMVAFHPQKRGLHDLIAGTYVVKD